MLSHLLHRLAANPWIYDRIQAVFGLQKTREHLAPHLAAMPAALILDVGAGTGIYRALFPTAARYIGLDLDPAKLGALRQRQPHLTAVLRCDASRLCLANHSVDVVCCIALSHHLTDSQLERLWQELARVVIDRVVFLDAVAYPRSLASRLLWKYDRGSHPRSDAALLAALEPHFVLEHVERYAIYHHYLLCIGRPRCGSSSSDEGRGPDAV